MDTRFVALTLVIAFAVGDSSSQIVKSNENETISDGVVSTDVNSNLTKAVVDISHGLEPSSSLVEGNPSLFHQPETLPSKPKAMDPPTTFPPSVMKKTTTPKTTPTTTTTTTSKHTTPETTTSSTTTTTSTTIPPKTTEKPVPAEPGEWMVTNASNACILLHMEIQFNLTYPSGNTTENETISVPKNATAEGNCNAEKNTSNIVLRWNDGNSFEIVFFKNTTSEKFYIKSFILTLNASQFNYNSSETLIYKNDEPKLPVTPVKMSYKCDKVQEVILTSSTNSSKNSYSATLMMSHTHFEAFRNKTKTDTTFADAKDCEGFDTPDIVPIAVGCVLSVLVIVVLVAYLIGRRRSQNRGYLSM